MTTFHLHGGGIKPQIEDGTINKLIQQNGSKHTLVFASHHSKGESQYLKLLGQHLTSSVTHYKKGLSLSIFDNIFISGGTETLLLNTLNEIGRDNIISLLQHTNTYIGCSSGAMILGKYYYGWGSKYDNPYGKGLMHNGLGIFPDSLFEVHYSQVGFQSRLHQSIKYESKLKHFFGIDVESIVTVEGSDVANARVTLGTAEIIHR